MAISNPRSLPGGRLSNPAAPASAPAGEAPAADPGGAPAALSQGQRSLWFLQHLAPESGAYNIAAAARVRTPIEAATLERAAQALVDRHAALRTTFPAVAGEPRQRVAERLTFSLGREETAGWSAARLADRLAELAWTPFDLARGPLLRLTLLAGDAADPVLLLVIHHIVADFWSLAILMRELPVLYRQAAGGEPARLGPPGMAYTEHVRLEEELLAGGAGEERLAYWQGQLAGLPTLELATDRPRPAVQTFRGDTRRLRLPAALAGDLRGLSRARHGTLFMALAAAWQALLGRHSGQEDIALGTQRAGRAQAQFAGTVGYFVNSVVLRGDLAGDPGFGALFARTRAAVAAAFAQDYPLPLLAEHLQPDRDASRTPLFQVSLVLHKEARGLEGLTAFSLGEEGVDVDLGELRLASLSLGHAPAPFDLLLHVVDRREGLGLALQYSADLWEGATAARLLERFALLLESVVANPDLALSAVPMLAAAERRQLLAWNAGRPVERAEQTLQALFEAQAARAPQAQAVTLDGESWTYGELNRRANRLAWRLRRLGVGPEVRVGALLDRSRELVVALLGILKAGGAYVPLDPTAPAERLELLCRDAALQVLVTHGGRDLPPVSAAAAIVDLAAGGDLAGDAQELATADERNPPPVASPDNLCYVIFTSGSTGRPKGVLVRHGSVARLLSATATWFGFGPADVWALFHSYSFDFSVWELWGALAHGGRLVVVPHWVSRSPAAFRRLLADQGVTVLNQTPSAFRQLIEADRATPAAERAPLALRWVIFGGEALDLSSLRPWYQDHDPAAPRLVNMYGITETTVHVTWRPLGLGDLAQPQRSPIGEAIPDLTLRLLGPRLELVPPGAAGELCVGGAGVARGYQGRPDLTAERFVPDPFAARPGERLYRSGDRGRYRPDGQLDYLGRLDQQVKVRGFRVEPAEIEAALLSHPAVRAAVVVARQDLPGGVGLVACVVSAPGAVAAADLRQLAAARLPEYMVPAVYLFLEALPQTANGKLDRRALAALPLAGTERGGRGGAAAPRTPTEELVAGIFATVLRVERPGIEEDFFALGGHSLLATQVTVRVGAIFGVELPVRALFEAPTAAALAGRIDSILVGGTSDGDGARLGQAPLVRVSRQEPLALSFAQQRLWFLDLLEPGTPLYNVAGAVELCGRLDVAALGRALAEVTRRHDTLRTTFRNLAGQPAQVVAAPAAFALPLVCLAGLPAARREGETRRLASAEARTPFDLAGGPIAPASAGWPPRPAGLLRVALLRSAAERHVLLLTLHHIVSDGWSMGVLVEELGALYAAYLAGRPSPLVELPIQYADFAAWQRRQLTGERLGAELAWWRRQLAGMPQVLQLPADHPRPAVRSLRGAVHGFAVADPDASALARLARQQGATLFMTLLAGFGAVLGRHTGQDDLAVGMPIAGRTRVETEPLIGLFVNTLALRLDLAGDPEFGELLGRVRETALAAHAHQELPFERLVEELAAERDGSRPPLVQVMLGIQQDLAGSLDLPGLALTLSAAPTGTAKFELTCTWTETAHGLLGEIEYSRDLFDAATIARLAAGYARLLAGAVAEPHQRLSHLPLLSAAERQQALVEWNDSDSAYPRDSCLQELFAAVAGALPEAPAIVAGDDVWSYRRLHRASHRLARHLHSLGVAPQTPVCVSMERSPELIVGILAIVMAGGIYVPLDAGFPDERLDYLLADAGAEVVLVHGPTRQRLAGRGRLVALVAVDEGGWDSEDPRSPENPPTPETSETPRRAGAPPVRLPADALACLIYTSGSTGLPKGVALAHRGIVRLAREASYLRLGPGDRMGQAANISFDAATYEIWGPLLNGAAMVVIPREAVLAPEDLAALLRQQRVSTQFLTTALFTKLARELPGALAGLSNVLFGGEAVDPAAARTVLATAPPGRLLHFYGPAESTTFASWQQVQAVAPDAAGVPIGLPVSNTSIYVLDRFGAVVPSGAAGELTIGGDGLARGYWSRPDLTAERFVPHPWVPGERLYRTGDLVRRTAAGPLEFLGRLDHQVKIRGFRVEPGEVEAVLRQHPGVREAAVVVVQGTARRGGDDGGGGGSVGDAGGDGGVGDRRLAAYVEAAAAAAPAAGDLRRFVQARLPAFMVPASFTVLPALPRSPLGKLDRRALAARAVQEQSATPGGQGPRTPAEELVAGIFAEVLQRPQVGVEDDFFALGGHSLLATQVVSRVRSVFGVTMAIRTLFEAPVVAALAARIERLLAGGTDKEEAAPPIQRVSRQQRLTLSFAQQRLWFLDRLEPGSAQYNLAATVRLRGQLDRAALAAAWSEIVRRHEVLRTRFLMDAGEPHQEVMPPRPLALPVIDLARLPAGARLQEEERLTREEARAPFDLTVAPLLRVSLLALAAGEQVALVTMHHIASDGWSVGVLTRELGALYTAFLQRQPSPLPELEVQYADFAAWQRQVLDGGRRDTELAWWRQRLAGAPAILELPTDRPRPALASHRGAERQLTLGDGPALAQLGALSRRHGATLFMTSLAAFAVLLARWSGQQDMVVGTPVAGRTRAETEPLIGFFVNTLPLRVGLAGDPGFLDLLEQVRETTLGAYAHQELPFERLVEELVPDRDASRPALVQVLLVLQNAPADALSLPGLELSVLPQGTGTAKFEITVALTETAQGLACQVEYRRELFDAATIARLAAGYARLLAGVAAEPHRRLSDLPLLSAAERHQILVECIVPHPWAVGEQVFRTGELVRQGADGAIELLAGKIDNRAGVL